MLAFELLFRLLQLRRKLAVKAAQNLLPRGLALLDGVQRFLHAGCKLGVHDIGELVLHQPCHDRAERRRAQVFTLLDDVLAIKNGGNRRRVGRGSADAVLLHRADQRRVGVAHGRLREMLLRREAVKRHDLPLDERRQLGRLLLALIVAGLLIQRGVARELEVAGAGAEIVAVRLDLDADAVVDRVRHLAREKTAPDQAVQAVLLAGEVALDALRRQLDARRADRLVRVLRARLGAEAARRVRIIILTVAAENKRLGGGKRLLGNAQRVGTHVGDEAHRALAGDVHALVELLRDGHRAARRHVQLTRRLLLEGRGRERRGRRARLVRALDGFHLKRGALDVLDDGVDGLFRVRLGLFAVLAVIVSDEGLVLRLVAQRGFERPILLRLERLDLLFPVVDHAHGDGLHAPRGEAAAHLFPQQRRELIAHDAVEDTARLLRVHQILINGAGLLDALADDLLRDLVERDALRLFVVELQQRLEVPRDRLALAVRVRREIDDVARLGGGLELLDERFLALDGLVVRLKVVFDVDAELALGQVAQMSHARRHGIALAEILADGLCLCRRLDDDQILLCHSWLILH